MHNIPDNQLLARYLSGECTEKEINIIGKWVILNPENKKLVETMREVWDSPKIRSHQWNRDKLWVKIVKETGIALPSASKSRKQAYINRLFGSRLFKAAAVLLLAFSLPYFYSYVLKPATYKLKLMSMEEIVVEKGKHEKLTLSDGSRVILDAGSKFYYSKKFSGEEREVYLNGEGYFEVAGNPQKPFIVHANEGVIKVLGTKFNVRAWKPTQRVEVVVAEGKVLLTPQESDDERAVIIAEEQMSILKKDNEPLKPFRVDVGNYLGWIKNEVAFNNAPLSEILHQIERWYNLEIRLKDKSLASERLTVHIQNKPAEEILHLIAVLMELNYERTGSKIVFVSP